MAHLFGTKSLFVSAAILAVFGSTFSVLSPATAFNISAKGRVHERLTRLAELCYAAGQQKQCPLPADRAAFDNVDWKKGKYWRAVRWPDDPTDQSSSVSIVKFAVNAGLGRCSKYLEPERPFAGLMCNSHYGNFQFMHAMKSTSDEDAAQTKSLIREWTRFAFRVASGRIDPEADYCTTVRQQGELLSNALAPGTFPYCQDRKQDGVVYKAWRVRTLFTLKCHNAFSSAVCKETIGEAGSAMSKQAATGALLHLIQDSFSSSHTGRSTINPTGPYTPIVDCAPVQEFYFYAANKSNHGAADKAPLFRANCRPNASALDPVSASAQMLGLVDSNHPKAEADAVDLVITNVLG